MANFLLLFLALLTRSLDELFRSQEQDPRVDATEDETTACLPLPVSANHQECIATAALTK